MKIVGINGSPRRNWNTATLVRDALDGASEAGAETEMFDLYELDFKGCTSCFACKRIGLDEHKGRGYALDYTKALMWYQKAADQGYAPAQYNMGFMYEQGHGVAQDYAKAVEWYRKAAENNDAAAQYSLGLMYEQGTGVPLNITEAQLEHFGIDINRFRRFMRRNLGHEPEELYCYNTWQYPDYDRYEHQIFDMESKRVQREEQFSKDREAARALGARLADKCGSP